MNYKKIKYIYEGYGIIFNKLDLQNDIILPGRIYFNNILFNEKNKKFIIDPFFD